MFEGLGSPDWFIIAVALLLGFGIVRYLITAVENNSEDLPEGERNRHEEPQTDRQSHKTSQEKVPENEVSQGNWHQILGVESTASLQEIKVAYKRRISQYHPDKVMGLGEEFAVIAERKSKEINWAFEQALLRRS